MEGRARAHHSSLTRVKADPLSPVVGQSDCARCDRLMIFLLIFVSERTNKRQHHHPTSTSGKVLDCNTTHSKFVEDTRELLEDVKIDLCNLASRLVTAPITGRMFLPLPVDYVSPEDA